MKESQRSKLSDAITKDTERQERGTGIIGGELAHLALVERWIWWVIFVWLTITPQKTCKCFPDFFLFRFHSTFVSLCPSSSLSLSLLVAINYTDSLTGWNKEIKHLNIVSWCMHSSPLPNTDIEEILHSSCQLTKLHPNSQATRSSGLSISVQLPRSFQNMQGLHSACWNPSFIIFNNKFP